VAALGTAGAAGKPVPCPAGGVGEGGVHDLDELTITGGKLHEDQDSGLKRAGGDGTDIAAGWIWGFPDLKGEAWGTKVHRHD